jgi:hypothetical protein
MTKEKINAFMFPDLATTHLGSFADMPQYGTLTTTDTVTGPGDVDMFSFDVRAGQRLAMVMTPLKVTLDYSVQNLGLFDDSGHVINRAGPLKSSDRGLVSAYIDYTFPVSGRYYVAAGLISADDAQPLPDFISGYPGYNTLKYKLTLTEYRDPYLKVSQLDPNSYSYGVLTKDPVTGLPFGNQQQTFYIATRGDFRGGLRASMPELKIDIENFTPNLNLLELSPKIDWEIKVTYSHPRYSNFKPAVLRRTVPTLGPDIPPLGLKRATFLPFWGLSEPDLAWGTVRGGDLDITALVSIGAYKYKISTEDYRITKNLKVGGINPTEDQVTDYVDSLGSLSGWPNSSGHTLRDTMIAIIRTETTDRVQFDTENRSQPIRNTGGDGGLGIMQITKKFYYPNDKQKDLMPEDAAWNWMENINLGKGKLEQVVGLPERLRTKKSYTLSVSEEYRTAVATFKAKNPKYEDYRFRVEVPSMDPKQKLETIIRAYNGAPQYMGTPLNEYDFDRSDGNIVLDFKIYDSSELVEVSPRWKQVNINLRRRVSPRGDFDYVSKVLGNMPN